MEIVKGDICHLEADVIVQQCNCVTKKSHGLSQQISLTYPYFRLYDDRKEPSKPGQCIMFERNPNEPIVACLLGQYYPGKPGRWDTHYGPALYGPDTSEARSKWFQEALEDLSKHLQDKDQWTVVFPWKIGCGLAGGDWSKYVSYLMDFTNKNKHLKVFICQLPNTT